jgi:hypothetical protein
LQLGFDCRSPISSYLPGAKNASQPTFDIKPSASQIDNSSRYTSGDSQLSSRQWFDGIVEKLLFETSSHDSPSVLKTPTYNDISEGSLSSSRDKLGQQIYESLLDDEDLGTDFNFSDDIGILSFFEVD